MATFKLTVANVNEEHTWGLLRQLPFEEQLDIVVNAAKAHPLAILDNFYTREWVRDNCLEIIKLRAP